MKIFLYSIPADMRRFGFVRLADHVRIRLWYVAIWIGNWSGAA